VPGISQEALRPHGHTATLLHACLECWFSLKTPWCAGTGQGRHRGCQAPSPARLHTKMQPLPGAGPLAALAPEIRPRADLAAAVPAGRDSTPRPSVRGHPFVLCSPPRITGQGPLSRDVCRAAGAGPQRGRCLQTMATALLVLAVPQLTVPWHLSGFHQNNRPSPRSRVPSHFFALIRQF